MSTPGKDEPSVQEDPISKSSGKGGSETSAPGRVVSDEEKGGVSGTELDPEPALGVGGSINTSAEDQSGQESGREGTKGATGRPVGTSGDETSGVSKSADDEGMGQGQGG